VGSLGYHTMGTIRTASRMILQWSENADRMDEIIIKATRILVERKKQRKSLNHCKTKKEMEGYICIAQKFKHFYFQKAISI
jgi:hypothetical protein